MEDAYFTGWTPTEMQAHAMLGRHAASWAAAGDAKNEKRGAAAAARIRADRNAAEVTIAAVDRRGLFADLAQVMTAMGANIVAARVYTSRSGQALDVFYVQDASGAPFGGDNASSLSRLTAALEAAARGEPTNFEARRRYELGRAAAFDIAPVVAFDNDTSNEATVIEISGRDRPGLLEVVSRALAEANLSIVSAHIENYGERAVDAFYVHGADGGKVTDTRLLNGVKKVLSEILSDEDHVAPSRPRLTRARASVAR